MQFKETRDFQALRFTDETEYFKELGVEFSSLCNILRLAFKTIILSKHLNEFF